MRGQHIVARAVLDVEEFIFSSDLGDRQDLQPVFLAESELTTNLLPENAYQELSLRNRVNDAANAATLSFFMGSYLDQIGAKTNVKRFVLVAAAPDASPPMAGILDGDEAHRLRIQKTRMLCPRTGRVTPTKSTPSVRMTAWWLAMCR